MKIRLKNMCICVYFHSALCELRMGISLIRGNRSNQLWDQSVMFCVMSQDAYGNKREYYAINSYHPL